MSLLAMPFLIINYGGEMIYILEQRLHSQQIKAEKAQKVCPSSPPSSPF